MEELHSVSNPAPDTDPLDDPLFQNLERKLEQIAKKRLGIPTLKSRGRDRLDFHEVHVDALSEALVDVAIIAYRIGKTTGGWLPRHHAFCLVEAMRVDTALTPC